MENGDREEKGRIMVDRMRVRSAKAKNDIGSNNCRAWRGIGFARGMLVASDGRVTRTPSAASWRRRGRSVGGEIMVFLVVGDGPVNHLAM